MRCCDDESRFDPYSKGVIQEKWPTARVVGTESGRAFDESIM